MTGHGFGRTDGQPSGMLAKHPFDGLGLGRVVVRRRRAVGVDIVDLGRLNVPAAQRLLHAAGRAFALGRGRSHVVGVTVGAIADYLGIDFRPATPRTFQLFHHHDAGPFGHDKAVAALIKRAAGSVGFVVVGRDRLHGDKAAQPHGGQRGFGSAGNHRLLFAEANQPKRLANGVRPGRTGAGRGIVDALGAVANSDLTRGKIGDQLGNKERRDLFEPGVEENFMIGLNAAQAADADPDNHTDHVLIVRRDRQAGLIHGHLG